MENKTYKLNAVICGSEDKNDELIKQFNNIGINIILLKTINIVPIEIEDLSLFDKTFDYTIFTSKNSVISLFNLLESKKLKLNSKKVVCIGKKTKEVCNNYGDFNIDVPSQNSSSGVFAYFLNKFLIDKEILIPGSKISNQWYIERLKQNGANVHFIPVYDNVATKKEELEEVFNKITDSIINLFVFTSPSAFNNLIEIENLTDVVKYFNGKKIAAIGDVTKKSLEDRGLKVDIVPENFNFNDLLISINRYYNSKEKN
ncbi:MAG TPA: uroporphyrinogen-III synthase [Melioribacteraceae bacterium]|nr:uroporphyrinogen-III synthase [Melioribacteraceae bacterium]